MGGRILLAGLVGGVLMFGAAFGEHMFLGLVGRQMKTPANESTLALEIDSHFKEPGIYAFPPMPPGFDNLSQDDKKKVWNEVNEKYKTGPAAWFIVPPSGEDMMNLKQLGLELATNVAACLIAAIIVSMLRPDVGFAGRWVTCFLIGVLTWLSVNASYYLFYRFPQAWVQDELICAVIEWAAAGLAIAAIARPTSVGTR